MLRRDLETLRAEVGTLRDDLGQLRAEAAQLRAALGAVAARPAYPPMPVPPPAPPVVHLNGNHRDPASTRRLILDLAALEDEVDVPRRG